MRFDTIRFFIQKEALAIHISNHIELSQALKAIKFAGTYPVIVLVGGAAKIEGRFIPIINKVASVIGRIAEDTNAIILDGGTDAGVMASIGKARGENNYTIPLVGVAVETLVSWPEKQQIIASSQEEEPIPLESNHTHFILTPGVTWGDESPWISEIATIISGENPSLTVLINGGEISRKDVEQSLAINRPVIVLEGTGRLADELAKQTDLPNLVQVLPAIETTVVYERIKEYIRL